MIDYGNISNEELEKMAAQKDGGAICELGERYLYGTHGYEVNQTRAYQLLHKGEKMGLSKAYVCLGEMYRNGLRFAKNERLAREYYQKANVPYPKAGAGAGNTNPARPSLDTERKAPEVLEKDLRSKLDQADEFRKQDAYDKAKQECREVIQMIEDANAGKLQWIGNEDIGIFLIDAYWILAYTAFNEQDYQQMDQYLQTEGVLAKHPWGIYIAAVSHRIRGAENPVIEQDIQNLITAGDNNINLTKPEKGDVYALAADMMLEGKGEIQNVSIERAKSLYGKAVQCGNSYAQGRLSEFMG